MLSSGSQSSAVPKGKMYRIIDPARYVIFTVIPNTQQIKIDIITIY
jgi:hypothetical protein